MGGDDDGGGGGGFCTEAAYGGEAGDPGAKGFNDAPSAEHGAGGDSDVAGHHHPQGNVVLVAKERVLVADPARMPGGGQEHDDNAHGFLGVVAAVAETEDGGGKELKPPEPVVDFPGMGPAEDPGGGSHE